MCSHPGNGGSGGSGDLDAMWITTVSSTDFTTGAATTPETVTKSNVSYWSGPATATTGQGTFTPGQATAANAVAGLCTGTVTHSVA